MSVLRLGLDGRELRDDVRTGIRRYVVEVVRAAAARGVECVVYGDRGTRLPSPSATVDCTKQPSASRWRRSGSRFSSSQ